jgi:hypothetical protein
VLRRQNATRHRKAGMSMAADGSLQFAVNELITLFGMGRYAEVEQRARFACGVAADRLIFAPLLPFAEHLARASLADIALDRCPYGSHTTASDMLWAGVAEGCRSGVPGGASCGRCVSAPGEGQPRAATHVDPRGPCLNFGKPI